MGNVGSHLIPTTFSHCTAWQCLELCQLSPEWGAGYLYQGVTVDAPCLPRQLLTGVPSGPLFVHHCVHCTLCNACPPQLGSIGRDTDSNGGELTCLPHPEYQLSLGLVSKNERVVYFSSALISHELLNGILSWYQHLLILSTEQSTVIMFFLRLSILLL